MLSENDERLMKHMALRHVLSSLPEETARALGALVADVARSGRMDFLSEIGKESAFYAGPAAEMNAGDAIALAAFRYHLGRQTIAVHTCVDWLSDKWDGLGEDVRRTIGVEIEAALKDGRAGADCDANAWRRLLDRSVAPGFR